MMERAYTMCTIIAKNYLAAARTLCQSFLAAHPAGKCYVLIIDDLADLINPDEECFQVVTPDALAIAHSVSFAFKYNIVELSTAYKPFLMKHLLEQENLESLIYLDPDIQVLNPLHGIYATLKQYDIVLTPHLDHDYRDNLRPNTGNIIKHGIYNLGFIGLSSRENALTFLEWWQSKLYNDCIISRDGSQYVDQKIINIVPTIFPNVFVEHDVGCNVAYWNIHSRFISREENTWKCNGTLLYFFHFSSYDPNRPELITKPNHMDRYKMSDRPDLVELFTQYRAQMLRSGYQETCLWKYSLNYFANGKSIPEAVRTFYRSNPERWHLYGNPFTSQQLQRLAKHHQLGEKWQIIRSKVALRTRLVRGLGEALSRSGVAE